jgi:hypothetical protein
VIGFSWAHRRADLRPLDYKRASTWFRGFLPTLPFPSLPRSCLPSLAGACTALPPPLPLFKALSVLLHGISLPWAMNAAALIDRLDRTQGLSPVRSRPATQVSVPSLPYMSRSRCGLRCRNTPSGRLVHVLFIGTCLYDKDRYHGSRWEIQASSCVLRPLARTLIGRRNYLLPFSPENDHLVLPFENYLDGPGNREGAVYGSICSMLYGAASQCPL